MSGQAKRARHPLGELLSEILPPRDAARMVNRLEFVIKRAGELGDDILLQAGSKLTLDVAFLLKEFKRREEEAEARGRRDGAERCCDAF